MSITIEVLDWNAARARAMPVRNTVFVVEQGVPIEIEMDEFDAVSEHAVATDVAGTVIGTGRLLPDGHIGRMAVVRSQRGKGVGEAILQRLVARARERGFAEAVLNAQTHARRFYEKNGFVVVGPEFMEAGIPHLEMRQRLA